MAADCRWRVPKSAVPDPFDWSDLEQVGILYCEIDNGHIDGASILYRGRWYSPKKIIGRNIDLARSGKIKDDTIVIYNWRRSVAIS